MTLPFRAARFFLNGEPVYIRGVLLQPNFPINLINHPDPEMMVREITLAKQAGFNLIRLHLQPATPGFLDLADRLGMLIYSETSLAWIRDNPRLLDHGRREVKALIERDRNHPSIVFWGIYNENPPASALNGEVLLQYARAIDPTRVIVDNSGGSLAIDQDFGWIDRAHVVPAYESQPERILDIHLYLGAPVSASLYDWLRDIGKGSPSRAVVEEKLGSTAVFDEFDRELRSYHGQIFVSELGYGGMSDLDDTVAGFGGKEELLDAREFVTLRDSLHEGFQKRKLDQVFGSPRNLFLDAQKLQALGNTQQLEAVLTNPRVSGYIITQLNDVAWEFHGGLVDLWRNPKLSYNAALRLNQAHVLVLRLRETTAKPGDCVEIEMHVVNDDKSTLPGQLCVNIYDPENKPVLTSEENILLRPGIQPLRSTLLQIEMPGTYRIQAKLTANGQTLYETSESILSFDAVDWKHLNAEIRTVGQSPALSLFKAIDQRNSNPDASARQEHALISLVAQPATLNQVDWERLLGSVEAGETAVIGALQPEDHAAIEVFHGMGYRSSSISGSGAGWDAIIGFQSPTCFPVCQPAAWRCGLMQILFPNIYCPSWAGKSWQARCETRSPRTKPQPCCGSAISKLCGMEKASCCFASIGRSKPSIETRSLTGWPGISCNCRKAVARNCELERGPYCCGRPCLRAFFGRSGRGGSRTALKTTSPPVPPLRFR